MALIAGPPATLFGDISMKKRLIAVAAAVLAVGGITASLAGGMWQTLPTVAMQTFCAVLSTGIPGGPYLQPPGTTQGTGLTLCQVAVPAGPPALTGNELIPADTYPASSPFLTVPQGVPPATVTVPIILLDSGAYVYSVPNATRANFTLTNPVNFLVLDGTAVQTQTNIQLPGTQLQPALNGQQVHIVTAQSITTLGIVGQQTAAGAAAVTVDNPPTTLLVGATVSTAALTFFYSAPISTWFRIQ
jgi:hypothetical protein